VVCVDGGGERFGENVVAGFFWVVREGGANLWKGGEGGGFAGGDHLGSLGEIIPDELLDIRFDDYVGLLAPGHVGVTLDDVETAAEHVGESARLFAIAGI